MRSFDPAVSIHRTGIVFSEPVTLAAWERIGQRLRGVSDSSSWWLGDWLVFGETAYTGRYKEAVERTGLVYQTLRNYAWVARRFEHSRRQYRLSFAHYSEVARLEQPEQDYWLRRAEEHGWSRNQLRREIRASLAERHREAEPKTTGRTAIQIELPPEELDGCARVAEYYGLSLSEWAGAVLQQALHTHDNESSVVASAGSIR
ncbi:DUF1016 domain-containing protein [Actinoplanes sp. TBRC 11911]|nr:DUF1016 domain-containing protein [Actinoplanes sp. TBRC 11911]